ncbi:hypothetical protein ACMFMG_012200 [Clarireedia jacksonii]
MKFRVLVIVLIKSYSYRHSCLSRILMPSISQIEPPSKISAINQPSNSLTTLHRLEEHPRDINIHTSRILRIRISNHPRQSLVSIPVIGIANNPTIVSLSTKPNRHHSIVQIALNVQQSIFIKCHSRLFSGTRSKQWYGDIARWAEAQAEWG